MSITLNKKAVKLEVIALMPPTHKVDVIYHFNGTKPMLCVYPFVYHLHNVPLSECKFFSTWAEVEAYYN